MTQYVAVVVDANNFEHFGEVRDEVRLYDFEVDRLARDAIYQSGIKTPRNNPIKTRVNLFSVKLVKGQAVRTPAGYKNVDVPLLRMTNEDFETAQSEALANIPLEFHAAFRQIAWDEGHSAGYEEVVSILDRLIDHFDLPIKQYTKRIEAKNG